MEDYQNFQQSFNNPLKHSSKSKLQKLPKRFYRALLRNLHEITRAILERNALIGLEAAESNHGVDFFRLSYDALFNDMIAHAIKVLDKDPQSATFWYLYRCEKGAIDSFARQRSYDIKSLELLADRIKHIRDKTHFHIDKKGVFDPSDVWNTAGITGNELGQALETVLDILQHLHEIHLRKKFPIPEYDGSDATRIISAAQKEGIIAVSGIK